MKALARSSLFLRLLGGMLAVSLVAILAASAFLYIRFGSANSEFREGTLRNYTRSIARLVQASSDFQADMIPASLMKDILDNDGRLAIVSETGALVAGSPGVTEPLASPGKRQRDYFSSK
ncbi:MAG: Two-component sensor histidine kinase, partial [Hyphomicrobiales bacterium]|nr:Two-component sensor histidine kinase [Hyphomicrobiales bacterium]